MKMTFRWYGRESDPIPLKYVKQIPGMSGLMGLLDKPAGVDWPEEEVKALVEKSTPLDWSWKWSSPSMSTRTSRWVCPRRRIYCQLHLDHPHAGEVRREGHHLQLHARL